LAQNPTTGAEMTHKSTNPGSAGSNAPQRQHRAKLSHAMTTNSPATARPSITTAAARLASAARALGLAIENLQAAQNGFQQVAAMSDIRATFNTLDAARPAASPGKKASQ
jgi:hypothetical protein